MRLYTRDIIELTPTEWKYLKYLTFTANIPLPIVSTTRFRKDAWIPKWFIIEHLFHLKLVHYATDMRNDKFMTDMNDVMNE